MSECIWIKIGAGFVLTNASIKFVCFCDVVGLPKVEYYLVLQNTVAKSLRPSIIRSVSAYLYNLNIFVKYYCSRGTNLNNQAYRNKLIRFREMFGSQKM